MIRNPWPEHQRAAEAVGEGGGDGLGLLLGDAVTGVGHDDAGQVLGPRADGGRRIRDRAVAAGDSEDPLQLVRPDVTPFSQASPTPPRNDNRT